MSLLFWGGMMGWHTPAMGAAFAHTYTLPQPHLLPSTINNTKLNELPASNASILHQGTLYSEREMENGWCWLGETRRVWFFGGHYGRQDIRVYWYCCLCCANVSRVRYKFWENFFLCVTLRKLAIKIVKIVKWFRSSDVWPKPNK